jgi:antitoxin component YwqK of YwqJK toxin-antitoxin module
MNKILVLLLALICCAGYSHGQANKNTIYIIDSIPITEHWENMNIDIDPYYIEKVIIIKNRDSLRAIGYRNIGQAVLIFTKAYHNRPENIKSIPTTRKMILKDDRWYLKGSNTPYSGEFIDYYFNGLKQGEGTFKDGKLTGLRKVYHPNSNIEQEKYFNKGMAIGMENNYYEDGSLKEQGSYKNNKESGIWKSYYPNGQVQLISKYKHGKPVGTAFKYYSNGKLKVRVLVRRNRVIADPKLSKIQKAEVKGITAEKQGDYATAIKVYTQCIQMDNGFADTYFARGMAELHNFQLDDAVKDFDKAIEIEPYYTEAIANRALCKIRKNQVVNSRDLSSHRGVATTTKRDVKSIPEIDKQNICNDLQKAAFLGDKSQIIKQAMVECYSNKIAGKAVVK